MSRVFTSASTGAAVHVFSDDHCPPHVHARHRGDGWIARLRFSYVGSRVDLMSIVPLNTVPLRRTLNRLLADIQAELPACRRIWWETKRTACLTNQWAVILTREKIECSSRPVAGAKQIADATYDPGLERLHVIFQDGITTKVSTKT